MNLESKLFSNVLFCPLCLHLSPTEVSAPRHQLAIIVGTGSGKYGTVKCASSSPCPGQLPGVALRCVSQFPERSVADSVLPPAGMSASPEGPAVAAVGYRVPSPPLVSPLVPFPSSSAPRMLFHPAHLLPLFTSLSST